MRLQDKMPEFISVSTQWLLFRAIAVFSEMFSSLTDRHTTVFVAAHRMVIAWSHLPPGLMSVLPSTFSHISLLLLCVISYVLDADAHPRYLDTLTAYFVS